MALMIIIFQDTVVENGKSWLRKLLNQNFRVEMTDGRVLIGVFLCTDRDANVILGKTVDVMKTFTSKFSKYLNYTSCKPFDKKTGVNLNIYFYLFTGACSEYLKNKHGETDEPRVLGLVMVPGRHIVSIELDDTNAVAKYYSE